MHPDVEVSSASGGVRSGPPHLPLRWHGGGYHVVLSHDEQGFLYLNAAYIARQSQKHDFSERAVGLSGLFSPFLAWLIFEYQTWHDRENAQPKPCLNEAPTSFG